MKIQHNRRQGISMLETVIYVSLSAVLITLTAQWFHVVFKVASKNKLRQRQHASLKRLADDFRADVVSATGVKVEAQQRQATLTSANGEEIVYEVKGASVKKCVGDPKKPTRREVYPNLGDLKIEFVQDAAIERGKLPRSISMNVFRIPKQLTLEKAKAQKQTVIGREKALLQVRCAPVASPWEVLK